MNIFLTSTGKPCKGFYFLPPAVCCALIHFYRDCSWAEDRDFCHYLKNKEYINPMQLSALPSPSLPGLAISFLLDRRLPAAAQTRLPQSATKPTARSPHLWGATRSVDQTHISTSPAHLWRSSPAGEQHCWAGCCWKSCWICEHLTVPSGGWKVYHSSCELTAKCTAVNCSSPHRACLFHSACFLALAAATFWSQTCSLQKAKKRTCLICFPVEPLPFWLGFHLYLQQ